ncbi:MAG: 4-hydroxy-tetrahydrodipicolinate synthase [Flavitalea sp.]
MSLSEMLRGTGVAIITPFDAHLNVDFEALGRMIDMVIGGGVDYIVTLGTTGEAPTLDKEEKINIIEFTYEKVSGRVPVVVGIGGNNTRELIHELESFPLDKATAVLSASPYYSKPSQEGIFQHYKALAQASPKPIILYNIPGRTGRGMTADTILRLTKVDNIGGIKEASGDMALCMQILRDRPSDFLVCSGDDGLALPQIACGMDGIISVAANNFPKLFSDMVKLCLAGDFATAKNINDQLIDAYEIMFCENNPAGVKAFLANAGMIGNYIRLPLVPLSEGPQEKVKKYSASLSRSGKVKDKA